MTSPSPLREELLLMAETALDEGRPTATLELCQQLLDVHPEDESAIFLLAEAYRDLRDSAVAEDHYRALLERSPDHADAWSGLGSVLFDQCLFEEAGSAFGRAIRLAPSHPDALYGRAMLRERRGDLAGAQRDYVRAWQISTRYPLPARLDDTELRDLVRQAASDGDATVQAFMHSTPLIVLDVPESGTCEAYAPPASPGELLGHFAASMPGTATGAFASAMPPSLLIYRRNLERYAEDRERLRHALRESVLSQVQEWLEHASLSE